MKKVFLFTMLLFLTVSRWCYADKILISGNPIILENQGSGYVVPKDSIIMTSYYYVLLNGEKQVCFIDKQPALSALNIKSIDVTYKDSTMNWVCYPFDSNYFTTQ